MKFPSFHIRVAALLAAAFLAGAARADDSPVIASGKKTVAVVKQFYHLCPGALSTIMSYAGTNSGPRWASVAAINGRYVLTVQFDVALDDSGDNIASASDPTFEISEIQSVNLDADGQVSGYQEQKLLSFGPKRWQELLDHGGDFSVLGLKLVKNQPVANMDKYLQSVVGASPTQPATGP